MPIYVYACTNCGERTEAKQGFDDPPLEICPHCEGKLRKMYSPVGIVFKGSGFYSTDAKRSSASTKSSSETSSGGDTQASGGDTQASGGDDKGSTQKSSESKSAGSSKEKSA